MVLPLIVHSLLLIALLSWSSLLDVSGKFRSLDAPHLASFFYIWALACGAALLSIVFVGKPGLLPQYISWAVIILQVLRLLVGHFPSLTKGQYALELLIFVLLLYLWGHQLPLFQTPTYPA